MPKPIHTDLKLMQTSRPTNKPLYYAGVLWVGLTVLFCAFSPEAYSEENIKIKILAVNPSSTQKLKTVVAQYLPAEVGPDDILDIQGMEVKYDPDKKSYIIQQEVELEPSEARTIEVKIKNVWTITPDQIEEVKTQLKQSADALAKTKFSATGKLLYERASESIASIEDSQSKSMGIMQKIDLYRVNIKQLEDLKQNALSLEAMRKLEDEKKTGTRTAKFVIHAENPASEERKLSVRSELPRDIKLEDVVEKGDFKLTYDEKRSVVILEQEATLSARESKKYTILIKDVWYIPQSELDFLKNEIEKMVPLFIQSPYEDFALKQKEMVLNLLKAIVDLQAEVESSTAIEDRIRAHVLNSQREKSAKRKIKELQDLLSEVSLKVSDSKDQGQFQQMIKKIIDMKDKILVALGKQPQKTIYWWFFLGIVLFLAVVTIVFYGTWLKKLQDNKWSSSAKSKSQAKDETGSKP